MKKILVIPDTHAGSGGEMDTVAVRKVLQFAKDEGGWTHVVHLGDLLDLPQVAAFNRNTSIEMKSMQPDFDAGRRLLCDIQDATPGAEHHLIQGNHDLRLDKWLDRNPKLRNTISFEERLGLKGWGWNFHPYYRDGKLLKLGPVYFAHGVKTSKTHALDHLKLYGVPLFYGHTHTTQQDTLSSIYGGSSLAQSMGCLCHRKPLELIGYSGVHQQAFGIVHVDGGLFNHYTIHINNGKFITPGGQKY